MLKGPTKAIRIDFLIMFPASLYEITLGHVSGSVPQVRTKLEAYSILGNITVTWRLQEDHTVLKKLTKNPESPEILTPASSCLWDTE